MDTKFYEETLATARRQGNRKAEASALGALGNLYAGQRDYSRAIEYHNQAMQIYESTGDSQGIALSSYNLAGIYEMGLGDLRTAIKYFEKAVMHASGTEKDRYSNMLAYLRQKVGEN